MHLFTTKKLHERKNIIKKEKKKKSREGKRRWGENYQAAEAEDTCRIWGEIDGDLLKERTKGEEEKEEEEEERRKEINEQ